MEKFPSWHFYLLPALFFSAIINMLQSYNFPQFSVEVYVAVFWPGLVWQLCPLTDLEHCSFLFHFRSLLALQPLPISASVSICPTPESLFLYFLIKSMFNIILMTKCHLFQLQIGFTCLFWKSFTQSQGLETKIVLNDTVMCHGVSKHKLVVLYLQECSNTS